MKAVVFAKEAGPTRSRLLVNKRGRKSIGARGFLGQEFFAERLARDTSERLDDLELACRQRLPDEHVVNQVMVLLHRDFAGRAFELLADDRVARLVHVE